MDMEMIQYHPTTLAENGFLITEGARGEGAHLLNADGDRFMEKYAPNKMELASRDVVSRAEQTEINEGRGVGDGRSGIYLDITVVPKKRTLEALREIVNIGKDFAGRGHHEGARSSSARASTTSWAASRPTSTAPRRSAASTPRARSPASPSTAATASARTPCWTR
jgi:succinate dehydrogenase/fumarate reductase flavoprotein subunit